MEAGVGSQELGIFANITLLKSGQGTSLLVQWLRLHARNAGALGSILGQGTRSHMLQVRVCMPRLQIPCAATKFQCSKINKNIF